MAAVYRVGTETVKNVLFHSNATKYVVILWCETMAMLKMYSFHFDHFQDAKVVTLAHRQCILNRSDMFMYSLTDRQIPLIMFDLPVVIVWQHTRAAKAD